MMLRLLRNFFVFSFMVVIPLYAQAISYESVCERSHVPAHLRGDNPAYDETDFRIRNHSAAGVIDQIVDEIDGNVRAQVGCIEACLASEVSEAYEGSIGMFLSYAEDIADLVNDIQTTFIAGAVSEAIERYNEIECTAQRVAGSALGQTQVLEDAYNTAREIQDYYFGVDGIKTAAERARELKRRITGNPIVDEALNREMEEQHRIIQQKVNELPALRSIHEAQNDTESAIYSLNIVSEYIGEHTEAIASRMEDIRKVIDKVANAFNKIQKIYCRHTIKEEKEGTASTTTQLPLANDGCDAYRVEENQYRACLSNIQLEVDVYGVDLVQTVNPDDGCNRARIKYNQEISNDECVAIVEQEIIDNNFQNTEIPLKNDGCDDYRQLHNEGYDLDGEAICTHPLHQDTPECADPALAELMKLVENLAQVASALMVIQEIAEFIADVQKIKEYYDRVLGLYKNLVAIYQNASASWQAIQAIYAAISALGGDYNFERMVRMAEELEDSWRVLGEMQEAVCGVWNEVDKFDQTANEIRSLGDELVGDIDAIRNFDPNAKDIYAVYKMWRDMRSEDSAPSADTPEESISGNVEQTEESIETAKQELARKQAEIDEEMSWWERAHQKIDEDILSNDNIDFVRSLGGMAQASLTELTNGIPRIADITEEALDELWALEYEEATCLASGGDYTSLEELLDAKRAELAAAEQNARDKQTEIDQINADIRYITQQMETAAPADIPALQASLTDARNQMRLRVAELEDLIMVVAAIETDIDMLIDMIDNNEEFDIDRNNAYCADRDAEDDSGTSPDPDIRALRKALEQKAVYACKVGHLVGTPETSTSIDLTGNEPSNSNSCLGNTGLFDGVQGSRLNGSPNMSLVEGAYNANNRFNCDSAQADIYWRESRAVYGDMLGHVNQIQTLIQTIEALNFAETLQLVNSLQSMIEQIGNIYNYIGQIQELRNMIQNIDDVLDRGLENLRDAPAEIVECLQLDPETLAKEMLRIVMDVIRDKIAHELMYWFGYAGKELSYLVLPDPDYRPGDPLKTFMEDVMYRTRPSTGGAGDVSTIGFIDNINIDEAYTAMNQFDSSLSPQAQEYLKDVISGQDKVFRSYLKILASNNANVHLKSEEEKQLASIFGSENALIIEEDDNWLSTATAAIRYIECEDPNDQKCLDRQADQNRKALENSMGDITDEDSARSDYRNSLPSDVSPEFADFNSQLDAAVGNVEKFRGEPSGLDYKVKNLGKNRAGFNMDLSEIVDDLTSSNNLASAFDKPKIMDIFKDLDGKFDDGGPYVSKAFGSDFTAKLYLPTPQVYNKCGGGAGVPSIGSFCMYYGYGTDFWGGIYHVMVPLPGCDVAMEYKEPVAHVEISPRENVSTLGNVSLLNAIPENTENLGNLTSIFTGTRHGTKWGSGGGYNGVMQARVWGISPIARSMSNLNPIFSPMTLACEFALETAEERGFWPYATAGRVPIPVPIGNTLAKLAEPFMSLMQWKRDWFRPNAPLLGNAPYPLALLYTSEEDRQRWNPRLNTCGGVRVNNQLGEDPSTYYEHMGVAFDAREVQKHNLDYFKELSDSDECLKRPDQLDNDFVPDRFCASKCSMGVQTDSNVCIGEWGALLPRNGHHIVVDKKNPLEAMALLAYRAFDRTIEYNYISPYKRAKGSGAYGKGYDQWWMSIDRPYRTQKFRVGQNFDALIDEKRQRNEGYTGGMTATMWKETECCFRTCCDPHSIFQLKLFNVENVTSDPIISFYYKPAAIAQALMMTGARIAAEAATVHHPFSNQPDKVIGGQHVK